MTEQLPRRIVWFAPWTWKRRRCIAAALMFLMPIVYLESAVVIASILWRNGAFSPRFSSLWVYDCFHGFYWPLFAVIEKSPSLAVFYYAQQDAGTALLEWLGV